MITVSYIILKIVIISLVYIRILLLCSRKRKNPAASSVSAGSSRSFIEEDTKLEEKYERPLWDKQFPNILPPPVRVPEKENKEVDVELDLLLMSAPRLDKCTDSEMKKELDIKPSELTLEGVCELHKEMDIRRSEAKFEPNPDVHKMADMKMSEISLATNHVVHKEADMGKSEAELCMVSVNPSEGENAATKRGKDSKEKENSNKSHQEKMNAETRKSQQKDLVVETQESQRKVTSISKGNSTGSRAKSSKSVKPGSREYSQGSSQRSKTRSKQEQRSSMISTKQLKQDTQRKKI